MKKNRTENRISPVALAATPIPAAAPGERLLLVVLLVGDDVVLEEGIVVVAEAEEEELEEEELLTAPEVVVVADTEEGKFQPLTCTPFTRTDSPAGTSRVVVS
jgi:hypothetical protein